MHGTVHLLMRMLELENEFLKDEREQMRVKLIQLENVVDRMSLQGINNLQRLVATQGHTLGQIREELGVNFDADLVVEVRSRMVELYEVYRELAGVYRELNELKAKHGA